MSQRPYNSRSKSKRKPGRRVPQVDYRSLTERAPAILFRYRLLPTPEMEYVNPAVIEALGYAPEDFYADPDLVLRLLDEEDLPAIAVSQGATWGAPTIRRWRRNDGTYADVEDRTIAIMDRAGHVAAIEGVGRDVSAELAIQQELRTSRDRLDAVIAHVPVILWATDHEGRLTFLDGAGLRSLGVAAERLIGLTAGDVHPEAPRYRRHLLLALRGKAQSVEVRLGQQTFLTWLGPLRDGEGGIIGVTGVSRDVTHEKLLEADASEARDHATVTAAIGRLDTTLGLDGVAQEIAAAVTRLDGVDDAGIIAFGPGIVTYFLSLAGPGLPIETGRALPLPRSVYLREQADKGPWVERWIPRPADGRYGLAMEAAGLRASAYAPLRHGETPLGLLVLASRQPDGREILERRMSTFVELAALTVALIGPALATRRVADVVREELHTIVEHESFSSVYQPIVRLADRSVLGFEALTRFEDGTPPDRRFVEAESVGMGLRLEAETLSRALSPLDLIPEGSMINLNVSPAMILEGTILARLLEPITHPIVLEVTEHRQIDDYEAIRRALRTLPTLVGLAIDDAGAGFASLRHVIELRPQYVKLDRALISGVDGDSARRAVVAGMVQFARTAGCELIAEGVETEGEHDTLLELGVALGQGYLYARPAPLAVR